MATPSTSQIQPLPPAPSAVSLLDTARPTLISQPWNQWLLQAQQKINVINKTLATLSSGSLTPTGELSISSGGTGAGTSTEAFNNLSPLTADGDMLVYNNGNIKLPITTDGYVLQIVSGMPTWVNPSAGSSPLTTKGDIYGYNTAPARIPVGSDTYVLTADSTNSLGVSWKPAGTPTLPVTTKGDILGYSTLPARIPVGADGQALLADSTQPLGVKWGSVGSNVLSLGINNQSLSYTLVLADQGYLINLSSSTSAKIVIPLNSSVAFPIGTVIFGMQGSNGSVGWEAVSGVTLLFKSNPSPGKNSLGKIIKILTDTWVADTGMLCYVVYQVVILSDTPLAYWTFDTTLASATGAFTWVYQSGTALTYAAPLILQGNAANLSVNNTYYSIPYDSSFNTLTFSIEVWIKVSSSANVVLFECNGNTGFSLQVFTDGTLQLNIGGTAMALHSSNIVNGATHHIVFSCSPTKQYVYTDGNLSNSYSFALSNNLNSQPLYFGSRAGASGFVGTCDELAFYTYALSAQQVASHYFSGTNYL